ncbi:DUF421 domain-containing protein [Caballeronia sp. Lep1P3]|uniref:DUF421 domain-containing protein n=1 Tax=Caballeronia sp. Lep1P3 TaxID=2878150 RepID=UPI001FD076CC|nr:YetF domain-containing protein [Caballeronia sp. Lep1P3]
MQAPPFSLADWHRFLFGNANWHFLVEVLIRTSATYVLLVIAMRLLGRRVAAQYTLFEISIVVTLAAAIGVPLQAANRGMLPPFLIALVAVAMQRLIARAGITHRRVETMVSTDVTLLAREGRLELSELARAAMPHEKVFEAMRLAGWQHLGQVSRLYMEPSGAFSFIPARPAKPGLSVLPAFDDELREEARVDGCAACTRCGDTVQSARAGDSHCEHCGSRDWTYAVTEVER